MLTRSITYLDFDGVEQTETHSFHLSKSELTKLEFSFEGGIETAIQKIIEAKDNETLFEHIGRIILLSFGKRSEDGKRFVKSDELRLEFSQTPAYDALLMEVAFNADSSTTFIKGVLPVDLAGAVEDIQATPAVEASAEVVQLPQPSLPAPVIPPAYPNIGDLS